MTTQAAPAGWYADPYDASKLRWWDGQVWTTSTSPNPAAVAAAPVPVATATATVPVATATATLPAQPMVDGASAPFSVPAAAAAPGPYAPPVPYGTPNAYGSAHALDSGDFFQRNRYAAITFGIVAVYLFLAFAVHLVVFGIFPAAMSFRSRQRQEPLSYLAIGAAGLAVLVALVALTHR